MSQAQHTPGPWAATPGVIPESWHIDADCGQMIAFLTLDKPHLQANARLIAAAPDLLAALEHSVEGAEYAAFDAWVSAHCPSGDAEEVQRKWEASIDCEDFRDTWQSARAAIAKAKGGTDA